MIQVGTHGAHVHCEATLRRFTLELGHVVLNVTVERCQRKAATPCWWFGPVGHRTTNKIVLLGWRSQASNCIADGIFKFSLQRQRGSQTIRRKQTQASLIPMNFVPEFFVMVQNEPSMAGHLAPLFWIESLRLFVAVPSVRPRRRSINECELVQGECRWVKQLANERSSTSLLLGDLSLSYPGGSSDRRGGAQSVAPQRGNRFQYMAVENRSCQRKCD